MKLSSQILMLLIVVLIVSAIACGPATPTAAPTKPAAATAASVPAAATQPAAAAANSAPAATKPAQATAAPVAKIKRGGTLSVVVDFTWPTMDPHLSNWGGRPITIQIFDALLGTKYTNRENGKVELIPELAESWKLTDPTTIDMVLRKGVKFHDGSDFNAEVARWNIDRIINHPKSHAKVTLTDVASAEATTENGLRIKLKAPSAAVLLQLSHSASGTSAIVSKAAIDKNGEENFQSNPSGTGAMKFDKWVRDDRVTMKRSEAYWNKGADGQALPYLDGMVERFLPDKSVAFLELRTGNVDAVTMIDPKDIAAIKNTPNLVYWEQSWDAMYYNQFFNPQKEPYASNKKLRQAAWHAIDRDGVVKALGFGIAKPYKYPFWTAGTIGYDESLPYYNYDVSKAKQLMAEAGFEKGLDTSIKVINRTVEIQKAEALKSMFDAIGLRTMVDVLERLAWTSAIPAFNYDMAMNRPSTYGDTDLQRQYLMCGAPANWASYCNPEMDKCMIEGKSVYDEAKRAEIYKRCQRILYEDAASGSTFFLPGNIVYNKKVHDIHTQFNAFKVDARAAWIE